MEKQEYYIGIDAGTSSVGWAVTSPDYRVIKKNGKALWGVRLFEEASTAEKRRMARTARRRRDRQAYRQALLRELFAEEIAKVDPAFFLRLDESKFWEEDKKVSGRYCLFADADYNDRNYHADYPTIFHLRKELMESGDFHDIRLVYLAVSHIVKHRGHFLSDMSLSDTKPEFIPLWNHFADNMEELMELRVVCSDLSQLQELLQRKMSVRDKAKALKSILSIEDAEGQAAFPCIYDLLSGKSCDVSKSFDIALEGEEKNALKLSFAGGDMDDDEKLANYQSYLGDRFSILLDMKDLFDWGILVSILGGADSISEAHVASYEKHKADLKKLQGVVKTEVPEKYNEMFRSMKDKLDNYCAYTGHYDRKRNQTKPVYHCDKEKFYKYTKNVLKAAKSTDAQEILAEIELGTFLPLQRTKENSVVPYQIHYRELQKILSNAAGYHPFFNEADERGLTMKEKIELLMTYRVPYYVGPLDNTNAKPKTHWAVKKQPDVRVLPWNFDEVVDKEASAEAFMKQLTNTCTYLIGESVLPKDSIVYSRFTVLNELNNVKVYGHELPVGLKQRIFNELFLKKPQVKRKELEKFLLAEGLIKKGEGNAISGIDGDFKASLKTEIRLRSIFGGECPTVEQMDDMILSVLLLKQEREMLESRICDIYPAITKEQLKKVCKLNCSGWGRLSKKFLTELKAVLPEGNTAPMSILDAMWHTQNNLMQLLAGAMPYQSLVDAYNDEIAGETKLTYKTVEDLDVPPYVRRTVWQTLKIVKEICNIMGGEPTKIFVEMARKPEDSVRTVSRKNQLLNCYRAMGEEMSHWCDRIESYEESKFRRDALYLYFTQMGRCMYTGQHIDLQALLMDTGNQTYDIDHIYPRSKVKDDSLENRVLVVRNVNLAKSDQYPLSGEIREKQRGFWFMLYEKGLIGKKKLERLIRHTEFSDDELAGFISRQLVETRQSTKVLAQILERALPDSEVVFVKASNVSDFRKAYEKDGLVKVRDLNDYHHAKDAYLNIVVGNVYDVQFTKSPLNFIKSNAKYSMKPEVLFSRKVERGNVVAWDENSIATVKDMVRRNNIMITRQTQRRSSGQNGGLYDQNPVSGGPIPLKGDPRLQNTERYGGYKGDTGAYMFLVEHGKGKKRVRSIEPMYLRYAKRVDEDPAYLETYCREVLDLTDPKVIIPEIKFNTLLEIKGFPMYLTGRSGAAQITGIQAFQLVLPNETERYLKCVLKVCDRLNKAMGEITITKEHDKVTAEQNLALYDMLLEKMKIPAYVIRPGSQVKTLEKGRSTFEKLELAEQCEVLGNILMLFRGSGLTDLSAVGGAPKAGKVLFSRNFDGKKHEVKAVYTSVTGFYREEVDLLK